MEVKSFDFREEKKNDERCVGRIWHVEKKKIAWVFVKFQ